MNRFSTKTTVPAVLCATALVALTGAAVLLFDFRDDLASSQDVADIEDDFVSYVDDLDTSTDDEVFEDEPPGDDWEQLNWDRLAGDETWEVLEPESPDDTLASGDEPGDVLSAGDDESGLDESNEDPAPSLAAGGGQAHQPKGTIVVVTDFTRADVEVNGQAYPAYSDDLQNRGMELPAYESHLVAVEFDGNERIYEIELRPGEQRLLMVELTGMGRSNESPRRARAAPAQRRDRSSNDDDGDDEDGRITVYSRPRGDIFVGSQHMNERTPGTVNVDPGRHEVQVEYEDGQMSETKTVRVREGSRTKLFFRSDDED